MGPTLAIVALWLFVAGAPGVVTLVIGRRIWKSRSTTPTSAKVAVAIAIGGSLVGLMGTLFGAMKAFLAIGARDADPSSQARMLAEGISAVMNCTVFGIAVSVPAIGAAMLLVRRAAAQPDKR